MNSPINDSRTKSFAALAALIACAALVPACGGSQGKSGAADGQVAFATPEAAVQALSDVIGTGDMKRIHEIFGEDGTELLQSGDDVADREAAARVKAEILEKVAFEDGDDDETKIAVLGNEAWPFPIPLVQDDDGWRFDVEAGWQEIKNRRVGRNELATLTTLHEFVDAQREYAAVSRDGNPPAFAKKLVSSEGKHDGVYWPVAPGEPESPFGPEFAAAAAEGYKPGEGEPVPFHGFRYRLLTSQGKSAPGGAKSFLDAKGRLTGGFALLAWPAKAGNSGVKTFVVNQKGVAYERDFGEETETAVAKITSYDPDASWDPVGEQ